MKRILMIGPFNRPVTGMSVANDMLYHHLKENYIVDTVNTVIDEQIQDKETQGVFIFNKFIRIFKDLIAKLILIINKKYDILYITPGQSFLGLARFFPFILVNSLYKKRQTFLHIHGSKLRDMYDNQKYFKKRLIRYCLNKVNGIIVLGESLKSMLSDIVVESKILVSENGVQNEIAANENEISSKIKEYKNSKKINVVYLSNLMKDKGVIEVLKASNHFSEDEVVFNFAGEIEPQIREQVYSYFNKFPKKIKYHGFVKGKTKKKILLESHIFILPSKDEGQPISILEAYANGCSVISDENVGGIKDIFSNDVNGYACNCNNYMTIVHGIQNLSKYEDSMAQNYKYYKDKFTEERFVERIVDILERN